MVELGIHSIYIPSTEWVEGRRTQIYVIRMSPGLVEQNMDFFSLPEVVHFCPQDHKNQSLPLPQAI